MTPSDLLRTAAARITDETWLKVFGHRVQVAGDCLLWRGAKMRSGYGKLSYEGRNMLAHRLSMELFSGEFIPDLLVVMHTCDTPSCVNPWHLKVGTSRLNTLDMLAKRRHGAQTKPERIVRGEAHPWHRKNSGYRGGDKNTAAKLTWELVGRIRQRHAEGVGYRRLVGEFGIPKSTIAEICRYESWRPEHGALFLRVADELEGAGDAR